LNGTEEAVERRVGPLERAALGLAEATDRTSRVESDVAGLRAAMERANANIEDVQRGGANAKMQLSDWRPKVDQALTNLEQEVAKLKEEIERMKPKTGPKQAKQFPPSVKKGKLRQSKETDNTYDIPDGIIAHLTKECRGNVHDCQVVDITSGSFEKETHGSNPHSGAYDNDLRNAEKNAADLGTYSYFFSACRDASEDIPEARNNQVCYDFKERRIVPTHYTIRTNSYGPGSYHLRSWLVETSTDGKGWREVAREENNEQLNGADFTGTFAVADGEECRFIRLVNIGRNHYGDDALFISAWEIFGTLIE
jgi:hypothetical protein